MRPESRRTDRESVVLLDFGIRLVNVVDQATQLEVLAVMGGCVRLLRSQLTSRAAPFEKPLVRQPRSRRLPSFVKRIQGTPDVVLVVPL
ncbi:MAG: hypothetical protein JWQ81_8775 [Amycolatopsis sp.]|uniref:hypothetical protein n=1 Tax=Amycolatopsis sp. TaxID=37632 RepID=UPI0026366590|nr:hypothetical protein [Amycolatopsis sp.]MCU1688036.1 hypothetical protein [Amycolatopsis sp.]